MTKDKRPSGESKIATPAYERVAMLMRTRPDLAAKIMQTSEVLARNGISAGVSMSESELGRISPYAPGIRQAPSNMGKSGPGI